MPHLVTVNAANAVDSQNGGTVKSSVTLTGFSNLVRRLLITLIYRMAEHDDVGNEVTALARI